MSHCLSDIALFECYSGEGEPDALAHLKTCLACAGRFKVLQGEMPAKGSDVSVFIDIIGMPMTPLSFAGVARRSYRRAYFR